VDSRTLRLLELDKVLSRLEEATASSLGRARVRALKPSPQKDEARRRLVETTEARRFLQSGHTPSFGGVSDIALPLRNAAVGAMLDPAALVAVSHFAAGARRLREVIVKTPRAEYPILHSHATRVTPRPDIEKAVGDAIDDATKEIKDDASLDLLRARRNIRQTQANIQARLRQMLADPNIQPLLQDAFVTVRDGRYCLPVKAESRARVPGIVHDRSGSGGAFFVEPQAVVEMNNRLRELHLQEREAIDEILTTLSGQVAGAADDLAPALEACADLDFAFAKAHLAKTMNAIEPFLQESGGGNQGPEIAASDTSSHSTYVFLQACHPLIANCVPNDILLGDVTPSGSTNVAASDAANAASPNHRALTAEDGFDVMMITGPNTGGKTVVLKTLGLLTLMVCCGLHIPAARGSRLSLPGAVFADIGDEQSIEQSLSTFSSHVKQIIHILRHARAGDLVLLDEVGAGTDPDEGAALAKAILRTLQRRGVQVVATTHYGELKQFALSAQRFQNASVEFDVKTLRPTYHLRIGVPGASNALDIAARLGMPGDLVQRARRYLGRDRAEAEVAAQRLEETQRELVQQTTSAQRERDEVERLRREYETKLAKLQAQMAGEREASQREAEAIVQHAQEEADRILRELRGAAKESKQTEEARNKLRSLRGKVGQTRAGRASATAASMVAEPVGSLFTEAAPEKSAPETAAPEKGVSGDNASDAGPATFPAVGDMVRVVNLNKEGVLLSAPDESGRVDVRVGAVKVQVAAHNVEALPRSQPAGGVAAIRIRKAVTVPEEINLIGRTTEEALPDLEKYLDDAVLAENEQVRVVHGKGTGALRAAIHRRLKSHSAVREFHLAAPNEGGEGATIVHLG
jgi:DNA mismatch repair protein MutS2